MGERSLTRLSRMPITTFLLGVGRALLFYSMHHNVYAPSQTSSSLFTVILYISVGVADMHSGIIGVVAENVLSLLV